MSGLPRYFVQASWGPGQVWWNTGSALGWPTRALAAEEASRLFALVPVNRPAIRVKRVTIEEYRRTVQAAPRDLGPPRLVKRLP